MVHDRIQVLAIVGSVVLLLAILELVRRRRLLERYAVLWLLSAVVLLGLSIWRNLLEVIAHRVGIFYAPNALFLVALGFVLVLLLHFSLAVSRLAEQSKVLGQYTARLEHRIHELERGVAEPSHNGDAPRNGAVPSRSLPPLPTPRFARPREVARAAEEVRT